MKKKIVLYSILYMIVSIASAFGAIKISTFLQNSSSKKSETPPYQLVKIVDNITNSNNLDIDLNLDLNSSDDNYKLLLDADVDMSDKNNVQMQMNIDLENNESSLFTTSFKYLDNTVYLSLPGQNLSFKANNLFQTIFDTIKPILANVGFNLDELSLDDILIMLNNFTETKNKDSIILDIALPVVNINLSLICDRLYNLTQIILPELSLSDSEDNKQTISLNANIAYPEKTSIENNSSDFKDISNIINIASDILSNKGLAFNVDLNYGDFSTNGEIKIDLKNFNTLLALNYNDIALNLIFKDDVIYTEIGNLYFKFALEDLDKLNELLLSKFNFEIPQNLITNILDILRNKDFEKILSLVDFSNFNLSSLNINNLNKLDLSFLDQIEIDGNTTIINIEKLGKIYLVLNNENKLSQVSLNSDIINFNFNRKDFEEISLSYDENLYQDLTTLLPVLNSILSIIDSNSLQGQFTILYKEMQFDFNLNLSIKDEIYLEMTSIILGQNLNITLLNDTIYVEFSDSKLKLNINDTQALTELFEKYLGENIDITNTLNSLISILNPANIPTLISNINQQEDNIIISLFNGLDITIYPNEKSLQILTNIENTQISLKVEGSEQQIIKKEINSNEYIDIVSFIPLIENLIEYISSNKYFANFNISYNNISAIGAINYENGTISLISTIKAYNQQIDITLKDQIIYLSFLENNFKFKLSDFDKVKNFISNNLGIEIGNIIDSLTNQNFDILNLIQNTKINIKNDKIIITNGQFNLELMITDNMLDTITVTYQDLIANLSLTSSPTEINIVKDYIDIINYLPTIENIYNYIKNKEYFVEFDVNVDDIKINGFINYYNHVLSAFGNINIFGVIADFALQDNTIYIDLYQTKLKFELSDFNTLREFLNNTFGLNINQIDNILESIKELKINENDIQDILSKLTLSITEDKININYENIFAEVDISSNNLQGAKINYQDITANLKICNSPNETTISGEYIDLIDFIPTIENVYNLITSENIYLNFNANYDQIKLIGGINIENKNISIYATLLFNDLKAEIILKDKIVYISYDNAKIKFDIKDIEILKEFLYKNFGIDLSTILNDFNNIDFNDIIDKIKEDSIQDLIKTLSISITLDSIKASIENLNIQINLSDNNINSITLNYNEINADLTVSTSPTNIEITGEYINLIDLLPNIENVYNYIKNQQYFIDFEGNYKDIYFSGAFNFDKGKLSLSVFIKAFSQEANIIFQDNKVYVKVNQIKIFLDLQEIDKLATLLNNTFNIDVINILNKIKNIDFNNVTIDDLKTLISDINLDNNLDISTIINSLKLSISQDNINISLKDIIINLFFNDNMLNSIDINYNDLNLTFNILSIPAIFEPVTDEYINLINLIPTVENVYNYIQNETFYLDFILDYDNIQVKGNINVVNGEIEALANLSYNGLNAKISFLNNNLYIDINEIKLVASLNDIDYICDFVYNRFNYDIKSLIEEIKQKLFNTDIKQFLASAVISLTENQINIDLPDLSNLSVVIEINNNMISDIMLNYENIQAYIEIASNPTEIIVSGQYYQIKDIISSVDSIFEFVNQKQFDINAEIKLNDDIINGDIKVDLTEEINLSANVWSETLENMDISANIENKMLYFDYNGLCLKINNDNFNELLYIILEVLGIDPSILPFLQDVDLDLNFGQLQDDFSSLMGEITIDKVIEIINMLASFEYHDGILSIELYGNKLFNNDNAPNLKINLTTTENKITSIEIKNIYTDNTLSQKVDAVINFNNFTSISPVDQTKNYIDISGANEIIKAIVNMSNDTQFHIKGTLHLAGNLIGIDIEKDVPFDIKLKILEDRTVEAYAVIGVIPVIVGVNADQYQFGDANQRNRMLYIYVKGDKIYMYRTEEVFSLGWREHRLGTSMTVNDFLKNPFYYIQLGTGFSDSIINAIKEAISAERTNPLNYGNIIKSFDSTTNTINLNMREIADAEELDTLTLTLNIDKDSKNQNYLSGAKMSMNMPLSKDVFELNISSNDIQMVDYGKEVDTSAVSKYINSYTYEFGQYWQYRT